MAIFFDIVHGLGTGSIVKIVEHNSDDEEVDT
jgi:hypothetical protein